MLPSFVFTFGGGLILDIDRPCAVVDLDPAERARRVGESRRPSTFVMVRRRTSWPAVVPARIVAVSASADRALISVPRLVASSVAYEWKWCSNTITMFRSCSKTCANRYPRRYMSARHDCHVCMRIDPWLGSVR